MPSFHKAKGRRCGKEPGDGCPGYPHRAQGSLSFGVAQGELGVPTMAPKAPLVRSPTLAMELPFETLRMDPEPLIPQGHKYTMVYLFLAPLCTV